MIWSKIIDFRQFRKKIPALTCSSFLKRPLQIFGASESLFLSVINPRRGHVGPVEIGMIEDRAAKVGASSLGFRERGALQIGARKFREVEIRQGEIGASKSFPEDPPI